MTRMSLPLLFLLGFLVSCVPAQEQASIGLSPNPDSQVYIVDSVQDYEGTVSAGIETVVVTLNGVEIEKVPVTNGKFNLSLQYSDVGKLKLKLNGLDGDDKATLERNYDVLVRQEAPPSGDDPLANDQFDFPAPAESDLGGKINLWATYYLLPQLLDGSGSYALRDMQGRALGPLLDHRGWCDSAMEGSVRVLFANGEAHTYNYAGTSSGSTVDCKKFFRHDVSKTKFRIAKGPYGDGIKNYILSPYRTLATDSGTIAPGTVVYIPRARGAKITTDSGRVIIHDGYFFAGDRGGAIKGNHVDVFIGTHKTAPFFPWIGSSATKTFDAYVVKDQSIIAELTDQHIQ